MRSLVALLLIASVLVAGSPLACVAGGCTEVSTMEAPCESACGGSCSAPTEKPLPKGDRPEAPQPCMPFMRCCACTVPPPVDPMRLVIVLHQDELAFPPVAVALPTPLVEAIWHPPNAAAFRA